MAAKLYFPEKEKNQKHVVTVKTNPKGVSHQTRNEGLATGLAFFWSSF